MKIRHYQVIFIDFKSLQRFVALLVKVCTLINNVRKSKITRQKVGEKQGQKKGEKVIKKANLLVFMIFL